MRKNFLPFSPLPAGLGTRYGRRAVTGAVRGAAVLALTVSIPITQFGGTASAQGSNYAVANYIYGVGPTDDPTIHGCGSSTATQAVASYSCGPVGVGGSGAYFSSGFASAVNGQLRIGTNGSAILPGQGGAVSLAGSTWTDQASVTPIGAGSSATQLQIALHITGTMGGTGADLSGSQGSSAVVSARVPDGTFWDSYQWVAGPGAPIQTTSVDQDLIFTLALSNGSTSQFQYAVSAFTILTNSGSGNPNPTLTGSAFADFTHTVNPLWYHVLDANNADVTSNYEVQFAQGLSFGPTTTPTTTPEPSEIALLATGLIGLAPVVRRRLRICR